MKSKFSFFIAISCLVALSSCREADFGFNAEDIKYQSEFIKEFGKPDPNHTWGFEERPVSQSDNSLTRVSSPNANQWGKDMGLDVPDPLTDDQIRVVTEWFTSHRNPTGVAVNWTDYFAQQVSSTDYGRKMDWLYDKSAIDNSGNVSEAQSDHLNNFNNGDCGINSNVQASDGTYHSDKIQYMTGQSTLAFGFHDAVGQQCYSDHYVIIPGETIDPSNTYGLHGMFFVGFDYEALKTWAPQEDRVERDYYFNDWIVRISPGTYSYKAQRVMCEDLGGSWDWDFNDVVFDAYIEGNGNRRVAHIAIQAAGGTLPIIVGTTDSSYEIHSLFGVPSNQVVIKPSAPAVFTIDLPNGQGNTDNVKSIPIYVNGINVTARDLERSNVPQRFACPTTVGWAPELVNICKVHEDFKNWVGDDSQNVRNTWYLNPKNAINWPGTPHSPIY